LLLVPTPSGSVFLVMSLLLLQPCCWQAAVALASRPPRMLSGPENVQCRAVFIQYQRAVVPKAAAALPGSNPLLTHGTVESLAKLFLRRFSKEQRAAASNQNIGLSSPTPLLARGGSQKSIGIHRWIKSRESHRFQSVLWLQFQPLSLVSGGSHKFSSSSAPAPETSGWRRNGFS